MTRTELIGSEILDNGLTPKQWVDLLGEREIDITERTLRAVANRLGACCKLGNAMIITSKQMDRILTEPEACRSKSTNGKIAITTGLKAGSSSKGFGLRGHADLYGCHVALSCRSSEQR